MYFSLFFLQKIYRVGFLLALLLIAIDLLAFFVFPGTLLRELFTATREQTPLTWLSSLSFLFLGLGCLSAYYQHRKKIWYFLGAIFLFFSLDDATYLHERISGAAQDASVFLLAFPTYVWGILYLPLLIGSLFMLLSLLFKPPFIPSKRLVTTGFLLLGAAFGLDLLDGVMQKNQDIVFCLETNCHLMVLHLIRLTEEFLEVCATGLLGYVVLKGICLFPESFDQKEGKE